jgi:hypothetical protein
LLRNAEFVKRRGNKMRVQWAWEDGYVGNRPKQLLEIPDEELEGLDEESQERVIEDYVREAFSERIHYWWEKV